MGIYGCARNTNTDHKTKWRRLPAKNTTFFAEYSLLAMFQTYPAGKCTTPKIYTCVYERLVVFDSSSTTLALLKDEQFA